VSQPDDGHLASLAEFAGSPSPSLPSDALSRDLLRLSLLREAKMRGVPWSAIARATGAADARDAKREAKRLARKVQAALLARDVAAGEADDE
jgi:hypothetical protein